MRPRQQQGVAGFSLVRTVAAVLLHATNSAWTAVAAATGTDAPACRTTGPAG
jgi:hypothetical protein